jgi:hypothetical protein
VEDHAEGKVCSKDSEFLAEILAFQGRYQEAAKMFAKVVCFL